MYKRLVSAVKSQLRSQSRTSPVNNGQPVPGHPAVTAGGEKSKGQTGRSQKE